MSCVMNHSHTTCFSFTSSHKVELNIETLAQKLIELLFVNIETKCVLCV